MQGDLRAALQPLGGRVGVQISGQQDRLKEDQAGVPYRGSSAQHGQRHLGQHGLDQKQQGRADEHGNRENDQ